MLSLSNLLCEHHAGNEKLRYTHVAKADGKAPGTPKPVTVWAVTKACNLRCVHCYASAGATPAPDELTHEEGKTLLQDLKAFGVPAVLFSGGEPLVRPDTLDLMRYALDLGLNATLSTNGLLIDDAMADRLAKLGLRYVGISLDGTQAMHDKLRGQAGAFEGSLAAIDRCKARGIKVGVRLTVHAFNYQELDALIDICLSHEVNRLCVYHLAYAGRGQGMQRVDLAPAQTRQVMDRLMARTVRSHKLGRPMEILTVANHADAGYVLSWIEKNAPERLEASRQLLAGTGGNQSGNFIAAIDPVGQVHYDQFSWHYNCGNVRTQPFSRIWADPTDPRLQTLRNRQAQLPERCRQCRFLSVCNGNLRSRAESATGNWLGMDPACYLHDDEIFATQPSASDLIEAFAQMRMPFTD